MHLLNAPESLSFHSLSSQQGSSDSDARSPAVRWARGNRSFWDQQAGTLSLSLSSPHCQTSNNKNGAREKCSWIPSTDFHPSWIWPYRRPMLRASLSPGSFTEIWKVSGPCLPRRLSLWERWHTSNSQHLPPSPLKRNREENPSASGRFYSSSGNYSKNEEHNQNLCGSCWKCLFFRH